LIRVSGNGSPFLLGFSAILQNPGLSGPFRRQREILCESLNLFTLCSQQIRFVHLMFTPDRTGIRTSGLQVGGLKR